MKIVFLKRSWSSSHLGGDLSVINSIVTGLNELGHESKICGLNESLEADFVFFTNGCQDLRPLHNFLALSKKKQGLIGFWEDVVLYEAAATGLFNYVLRAIKNENDFGYECSLERLKENPSLVYFYSDQPTRSYFINHDVLKGVDLAIATSKREERTLKRDCRGINAKTVLWNGNYIKNGEPESFLKLTGLTKGEYIVQVGRIERRKNQLSTLLATADLDIPLVFIATTGFESQAAYLSVFLNAVLKWRKAPTFLISQEIEKKTVGPLRIIQMPAGKPLPHSTIMSAISNSALHLHPAFYELPGLTCLESVFSAIPTIASKWSSLKEYVGKTDLVEYVTPHDIGGIARLVKKKIGEKLERPDLQIFKRSEVDVAKEIVSHVEAIL